MTREEQIKNAYKLAGGTSGNDDVFHASRKGDLPDSLEYGRGKESAVS
ncbi:MAG: hypothetical protein II881_00850 [Oscillospiraceae bacterium]|nr:hypothetical protein [Oscillospiraceae bacterium]